jgi:hypothetical protein
MSQACSALFAGSEDIDLAPDCEILRNRTNSATAPTAHASAAQARRLAGRSERFLSPGSDVTTRTLLGWESTVPLGEGLGRAVECVRYVLAG